MGILSKWAVAVLVSVVAAPAGGQASARAKAAGVTAMVGPGGRVAIGDSLAAAKKAFPAPKGATEMQAMNFAVFGRKGWSWMVVRPGQAFEVSLKDGKVAAIARTFEEKRAAARRKLIDSELARLPKPSKQTKGKTAEVYAWTSGRNARFLVTMDNALMGSIVLSIVGDQADLKLLNYRADDTATLVRQMDMAADAMKKR